MSKLDDARHAWRLQVRGRLAAIRGSAPLSIDGVDTRLPVTRPQDFLTAKSAWKEQPVVDWLKKQCRQHSPATVLDIGAGVGSHTLGVASVAEEVHCLEPHPLRVPTLLKAIPENATVYTVAANDANEMVPLSLSGNRVVKDGTVLVSAIPVDKLDIRADVIKIDVEGHEEAVLDGASQTLGEASAVVVEVHNKFDEPVDPKTIDAVLTDAGFKVNELSVPEAAQTFLVAE
jgi:FkbM family methyltransferase